MPSEPINLPENPIKTIVSWGEGYADQARALANQYSLPIINQMPSWRGLRLHLDAQGWQLFNSDAGFDSAFELEFTPKHLAQGKDPLLKAMAKYSSVLDLTAGWGGDALHILLGGESLKRRITAIERNPVVFTLLQQAYSGLAPQWQADLRFLNLDAANAQFASNLALTTTETFEVVYLDPMFAEKPSKQAKSKKPMRMMQALTDAPDAENELKLFENAMRIATKRVVVKRALKAAYLTELKPQGSISSKLLRFDLYKPFS